MAYNDQDIDEFILDPYESELASVVMALSQVTSGLQRIVKLVNEMKDVKTDKITGDKLDLKTSSLPMWLTGATWNPDIEADIEDILSEIERIDLQLLEVDTSFRAEVNSVKNFDFDELRKSYDGNQWADRDFLEEKNRIEMDEWLRRRDE